MDLIVDLELILNSRFTGLWDQVPWASWHQLR